MDAIAFDYSPDSVRTLDADGRMHVSATPIMRACVSPYQGSDIPDAEALGLDPNKIYMLLRHPDEVEKAAPTFNRLPLLAKHVYTSAKRPQKEHLAGTLGSDATYADGMLTASMAVWDKEDIDSVIDASKRELSPSYHYTADMTPGTWEGEKYDGIMRGIVGNHVALVTRGRQGPSVTVADHLTREMQMKLTRTAQAARTALVAFAHGRGLAMDKMPDFDKEVQKVTQKNVARSVPALAKKLAKDMEIEPDELLELVEASVEGVEDDAPLADPVQDDAGGIDAILAKLKDILSPEDLAKCAAALKGDAPAAKADDPEPKAAMDAAMKAVEARMLQARQAEHEMRPVLGDIAPQKSADDVYKMAMDSMEVAYEGVTGAGLAALARMSLKARDAAKNSVGDNGSRKLAKDAADGITARFGKSHLIY